MITRLVHCPGFRTTALLPRSIYTSSELSSDALGLLQFGNYHFVLPENPLAVDLSHITKNVAPDHIKRPPYVGDKAYKSKVGDSLIRLGSSEEICIRRATRLARRTLNLARDLVKVESIKSPSVTV